MSILHIALLYLRSDSTTVHLADAKLSGQRDAFEKSLLNSIFLSLLKRDDIIFIFSCDLFVMHQGRSVSSNPGTRGRIVNKAKRINVKAYNNAYLIWFLGMFLASLWIILNLSVSLFISASISQQSLSLSYKGIPAGFGGNMETSTRLTWNQNLWACKL